MPTPIVENRVAEKVPINRARVLQTIHFRPGLNAVVVSAITLDYYGGVALLLLPQMGLNVLGVLAIAYGMILATFLMHEAMHGVAFPQPRLNASSGQFMGWLTGECYTSWSDMVQEHTDHHLGQALTVGVQVSDLPRSLRRAVLWLEWFHIPALSLLVLAWTNLQRFCDPDPKYHRLRWITLLRGLMFTGLGFLSLKALGLFFMAYCIALVGLRFTGAYQHNEDYLEQKGRRLVTLGTFSPLISEHHPWLNSLLLNFGYHSAHHARMYCPWYELPALDQSLFGNSEGNHLLLPQLWADYHHYRCDRVTAFLDL